MKTSKLQAVLIAFVLAASLAFTFAASPPAGHVTDVGNMFHSDTVQSETASQIIGNTQGVYSDFAIASTVRTVTESGETVRAIRHSRPFDRKGDLYQSRTREVETPPNEKSFNGFGNNRAREKV